MVGDCAQEQGEESGECCCESHTSSHKSARAAAVRTVEQTFSPMNTKEGPSSDAFIECSSEKSARKAHVPRILTVS